MEAEVSYQRVRSQLETLDLTTALMELDNALERARVDELAPTQVLEQLFALEISARHDRRVSTHLRFAGLPFRKRLEDFDFSAQPSIDQGLIGRLSALTFIDEASNVLFLGPPGVGKTALAVGLGLCALEAGHRILFISCHDLVKRLRKATRLGREERFLDMLLRPRLLILDEIGYTSLERPEANFLFEVMAKRYDRERSMIVTSNKSWSAWGEILPDQVMTAAILDRLLHRSVTINIQGESYRLRDHRKAGLLTRAASNEKGGGKESTSVA